MYKQLLAELGSLKFLQGTFHRDHGYYPNVLSTPKELFDWGTLNGILRQHRLESPRLRLLRDGVTLAEDAYLEQVRMRDGRTVSYVSDYALWVEMERGATLVIEAVDEACEEIGFVVDQLQRLLHSQVGASVYASRGAGASGLGIHWDDVDVLAVQLDGEKVWELRGSSRIWPLYRDSQRNETAPPTVTARYRLRPGDVLYVPRGWWHTAESIGSSSLHLAFGIASRTGADILSWIGDRLLEHTEVRRDLPRFRDIDERATYVKTLRALVNDELSDDVLDRYFVDDDARAAARAAHSLPWTMGGNAWTDTPRMVRVSASRMTYASAGDVLVVMGNGQELTLDLASEPLVALLLRKVVCSVEELCEDVGCGLSREDVMGLLITFARYGLVTLS